MWWLPFVKILLDECVDRRLARELAGHEVKAVPQMGWAGIKNGELLTLAEKEFEAFVTVDRNLSFQLNLPRYNIAVIVLRCGPTGCKPCSLWCPSCSAHCQRPNWAKCDGSTRSELSFMADKAKKTEHAGAKKGRGSFYGHKADAKKASNRRRRADDKRAVKTSADGSIRNKSGLVPTKEKLLKALMAEKTKEREL